MIPSEEREGSPDAGTKQDIRISARVFRARQARPWFVPMFLWKVAVARRWPIAGTWYDHGVVASTREGSAIISN